VLPAISFTIISRLAYNMAYTAYGGITDNMTCATVSVGDTHVCHGDAGTPLAVRGELGRLCVLGSWLATCFLTLQSFGVSLLQKLVSVKVVMLTAVI
jgi:Trypsin.